MSLLWSVPTTSLSHTAALGQNTSVLVGRNLGVALKFYLQMVVGVLCINDLSFLSITM